MARKFTKVSSDIFKECVIDSGILLKTFDVTGKTEVADADIVCDTTGDISATCVPTYSDMGEDVNNCPAGMKELMNLDGWETRLSFTALNVTAETIKMALGAADVTEGKVVPRKTLDQAKDFSDIWWVGDRSDGGLVAVCLKNAMSSDGFSLQTTKNGKGQLSVNMMGHYTITDQKKVPMEFYTAEAPEASAE
jgi:hypothetical protein